MTTPLTQIVQPSPVTTHKTGVRTSEFWLGLAAMILTPLMPVFDQAISNTANTVATHNTGNAWGALGPAIIATGYAIGRSYVKGQQAPDVKVITEQSTSATTHNDISAP